MNQINLFNDYKLLNEDWIEILNEIVDVSLFDLQQTGVQVTGALRLIFLVKILLAFIAC